MAVDSPFSKRTVTALVFFGVLSFAGAIYFTLTEDQKRSAGSNVFSTSAVGHMAFAELLERRGISVVVSRSNSVSRAGNQSLLVHAEPPPVKGTVRLAENTLLILPKRIAEPDPDHPGWVRNTQFRQTEFVARILRQYGLDGTVTRGPVKDKWIGPALRTIQFWNKTQTAGDKVWSRIRSRAAPQLDTPQLIWSSDIDPILSAKEGILFGAVERDGKTLFILSDPDLMSNAGIGQGDHAALLLDFMELMRPKDGAVFLDEAIHGFYRTPNLWNALFERPFIAATAIVIATLAVLLWAASGRFGSPVPPPPHHSATESDLIENGVGLLHQAGHEREIAGSYPEIVLRDLAERLHAPRSVSHGERAAWVDQVGAARQAETSYSALATEIQTAATDRTAGNVRLLRAIQRLHDWKQELIDGSGRH